MSAHNNSHSAVSLAERQRQRTNVRLAWAFGGIALALFVLAIWKYRPL